MTQCFFAANLLSWGHISLLIHKIKDNNELTWYAEQTINQGWSRLPLERHIKDSLFQRQAIDVVKSSNFLTRLSSSQSKLIHELLKQPYNFDFLGLHDNAHEREIEYASIEHITKFLKVDFFWLVPVIQSNHPL